MPLRFQRLAAWIMYLCFKFYLYVCCSQEWSESGEVVCFFSNQNKVAPFYAAHRIWLHNKGNALSCSRPKSSDRAWSDQRILDGPEGITPMSSHMASLSTRKQRDSKNWTDNRKGGVSSILCVVFVTKYILVYLHHYFVKHKAFTKRVVKPNQLSH